MALSNTTTVDPVEVADEERVRFQYGHLFINEVRGQERVYLFIDNFDEGGNGRAQRVMNIASKEVIIRQAQHPRVRAGRAIGPGREITVLGQLNANMSVYEHGLRPNIAALLGYREELHQNSEKGTIPKLSRVSYWKYHNGGHLGQFRDFSFEPLDRRDCISNSVIARLIHQILFALQHTFVSGYCHGDVSLANIFVHFPPADVNHHMPDFYLGHFGCASRINPQWALNQMQDLLYFANVIKIVATCWCVAEATRAAHGNRVLGQAERAVLNDSAIKDIRGEPLWDVINSLQTFVRKYRGPLMARQCNRVPVDMDLSVPHAELTPIMTAAWDLEQNEQRSPSHGGVGAPQAREKAIENCRALVPKLYHDIESALAAKPILGPWYVAHFDPTKKQFVKRSFKPHHRPNKDSCDSDTEENCDWDTENSCDSDTENSCDSDTE